MDEKEEKKESALDFSPSSSLKFIWRSGFGISPPLRVRAVAVLPGLALQECRELRHLLPHDFAGLELHGRARRNHEAAARQVGISPHARLGQLDLEHAEIAQLDGVALGQRVCNVIQRFLHHVEYMVLHETSLVADLHDKFPLG